MAQPDKRRRILDAAVTVFAQNGFYNSKVSQVAREAGVADGTIYLYFKNKEDILIQVFIDSMAAILARQETALANLTDPAEKLRVFIATHFNSVAESRALAEVLTVEVRQSSKFMRGTDMKPFGQYLGMIARIIDDGVVSGAFRSNVDSRLSARAIFGAIDELSLAWAMERGSAALSDACERVTAFFMTGLEA